MQFRRFKDEKTRREFSPSFGFLCRHVSSHFNLPVTLAGVIDGIFKTFRCFVGNPVCTALVTDEGGHVPYNNHTEAEVNGEGGCALYFGTAANGAMILFAHGFLRVR